MTLTDAGPLVALINRNDPHHASCLVASARLRPGPMLTTWPCFTEAMYLNYQGGGHPAQAALWRLRSTGRLLLHDLTSAEADRMTALMDKYHDTPMDLADASLVAVAETRSLTQIFTVDSDFLCLQVVGWCGASGHPVMPFTGREQVFLQSGNTLHQ